MSNEYANSLSAADQITKAVRRADNGIQFVDVIGSFVQNREFKAGYNDLQNGKDSSMSYVWRALSAIGQDVNSVVYSNVLNYVDAVANIDTCSAKALKSMMKLVGSSYQLFGNLDLLPAEVLQLLDILSISRKHILQNSKVKQALIDDIENAGVVEDTADASTLKWKYQFLSTSFLLSADDMPDCASRMYGKYDLADDYAYSYVGGPSYMEGSSSFKPIPYKTAESMENFMQIASDNGIPVSGLLCRSYKSSTDWKIVKYFQYASADESQTDGSEKYALVDKAGDARFTFQADEFESAVSEQKNYSLLSSDGSWIQCMHPSAQLQTSFIDQQKYRSYVEHLYAVLLSSIVTMEYNTKQDGVLPIYCYLRDEYYKTNDYYEKIDNSEGSRRRFKTKNNIPLSFDEKQIADNIDNGTDSLDNYFGAELELVEMEIASRARALSFSQVGLSSDQSDNIVEKYTRYSYYRKAKVLEYMHFIDNQYFSGSSYLSSSCTYEFNPNYYEVETDSSQLSCHVVKNLEEYKGDISAEIDMSIVETVASTLADLTMYIAKLREKVRLQTRKNYMKGTNNLIRYVINEYLVDLARNSPIFKNDALSSNFLSSVRAELSSHDIDNVQVVEYYDTTQYYNINTSTTDKSLHPDGANDRYWENVIAQDLSGRFYATDGIGMSQSQIDAFYLSTLNLKNSISGAESNTYAFLSTIFDLGASTSYVGKDGMFVTKLPSGQYSDEVYSKFLELSAAYGQLEAYSDGYTFNRSQTVAQQIEGLVQFLASKVSAEYFEDVSANYDAYMPYAQMIMDAVQQLSAEYSLVLSSYSMYLEKSDSPYSYDGSKYKHDYYIGNDLYSSPLLLDELGNLRAFANDDSNMHVWEFSDGLSALEDQFTQLSAAVSQIRTRIYAAGIEFNDIDSQYIDTELYSMSDAVAEAKRTRQSQLQLAVSTGRSLASDQYSQAVQQLRSSAEEYKQMEKQYSDIIAQYRSPYVNQFGISSLNYIARALNSQLGDTVTVTYNTADVSALDDSAVSLKDKCSAAVAWMAQPIQWRSEASADDDGKTIVQFGNKYNLPDTPYLLADAGTEAALAQIISRIEQMETELEQMSSGQDKELLMPLNTSFKNTYKKLSSPNAWSGDIAFTQDSSEYNTASIPAAYSSLADQLKVQYMQKASELDDADKLFKNDKMYAECTSIEQQIAYESAAYQEFSLKYSDFTQSQTVSQYLASYGVQSRFTMQECSKLKQFSSNADDSARRSILSVIDQMYTQYYSLQEQYVKLMNALKEAMPQYYYANNYLEVDVSSAISSIEDDVRYNVDLALIKVNTKMSELQTSLLELTQSISSSIGLTGSTVLEEFSNELQKYDVTRDPSYIAAKELFYQYSGLSDGQAPFFNYPNMAHSSRQLHDFMWNFIEADKYVQIARNSFDAVFVEELETSIALSSIDKYIGEYGQLVDTWKHNVQDYTGYSTRYIDSTHMVPTSTSMFEVADYDGAFYPPAIDMLRAGPYECISTLVDQFAVSDNVNVMRNSSKMEEDLGMYTASEFFVLAWQLLNGNQYNASVPNGNLRYVVQKFIDENSISGYNYSGANTIWMTSTKSEFASYVLDNTVKTFYERFYYPLGLSKQNCQFIAKQLSCDEVLSQISSITDSHLRKDVYDIYNYGLDTYGNMYILYKNYGEESPSYQTKKNTLGQMWIRMKDHPIAFPMVLSSSSAQDLSPIDMESANAYMKSIDKKDTRAWCYDFNFSDNQRLVHFSCKNNTAGLPKYFQGKAKYSQQALALVSQKTDIDLERAVLKISNPDDVPDDIVTQPYLTELKVPTEGNDTYAYQFLGSYAPSVYAVNLVYVKTNYHLADDGAISASIDCPPEVVVLKASNESMNIELQDQLSVDWPESEFKTEDGHDQFMLDNDQAVFSYNYASKQLVFAFLGSLLLEDGACADAYTPSTCSSISLSASSAGSTIDDPVSREMNSHDVFTECILVAAAKPTALGIEMAGHLKLYNTNADASYLPLYADKEALVDTKQYAGKQHYPFELLGSSKDLDAWLSRANPYSGIGMSIEDIYSKKVNGRIFEDVYDSDGNLMNNVKSTDVSCMLLSTAAEELSPLMNDQHNISEDRSKFVWEIDMHNEDLYFEKPEDVRVVMYNVDLNGKNPYYVCTLRDFMPDWSAPGGKPACYNAEPYVHQSIDVSSSVFASNASCTAVTTQPYANLSAVDNNNLLGISALVGTYDSSSQVLKFEFSIVSAGTAENTYIPKSQIRLLMFNPEFLSAFNNYHMLDIYGFVHIYDAEHQIVDRDGDRWHITYDKSRFEIGPYYFDKHGTKHMLSDVNFNDYDALADAYVVKGVGKLHFKYDEESIYDITDDMYYYPSVNIKYPYSPGSYLESLGFKDQLRTGSYFANIFNGSDYYMFRIDDPTDIANRIGRVSIAVEAKDSETALAFEDYVSSGDINKYDDSDIRNFEHLQFVAAEGEPMPASIELSPDEEARVLECADIEEGMAELNAEERLSGYVAAGGDYTLQKGDQVPQVTFFADSQSVKLDDALKVYVSYKKEEDKTITLYFNYMNYLDTPFIKIVDNKPVPALIDGTYLKLAAGEEGLLDIVVQFKYAAKQIVYGAANVVLVTYKIFNLSDDKPKFLVCKQQTVQPNQYEHIDIGGEVKLKFISREYTESELEASDDTYYVTAEVDAYFRRLHLQDANSFVLSYNQSVLQIDSILTDNIVVDSAQAGKLKVTTLSPDVVKFKFKFIVKSAKAKFESGMRWKSDFSIEDVQYYSANYELLQNIKTEDGQIVFIGGDQQQG